MNGNGSKETRSDAAEKQEPLKKISTQNDIHVPRQPPPTHYPFVYGYPYMAPPAVPSMIPCFPPYIPPTNYFCPPSNTWNQAGSPGTAATTATTASVLSVPESAVKPAQLNASAAPLLEAPIKQAATQPAKRPVLPSKSTIGSANASSRQLPDLSNAEELEKWKAQRRLKFPRLAANENEKDALKKESKDEPESKIPTGNEVQCTGRLEAQEETFGSAVINPKSPDQDAEPDSESEDEEGALLESPSENSTNPTARPISSARRRICKYFARGQCRRGTACTFEHDAKSPTGGTTLFERLVEQEDEKRLLRFFECIKAISAFI
jgi:hypothetical protein